MRVIVSGCLKQRSYQDKEGNNRTSIELEVDEIGPSLRYATAQVTRATQNKGGAGHQMSQGASEQAWATPTAPNDSWASPGAYGDNTPF